jgi:hypothetical protein
MILRVPMHFSQNLVYIAPNYLKIHHWVVLNNPKYDYASEMQAVGRR